MYSVNNSEKSYTLDSLISTSAPGVFSDEAIAAIKQLPVGGSYVVALSKITRTI